MTILAAAFIFSLGACLGAAIMGILMGTVTTDLRAENAELREATAALHLLPLIRDGESVEQGLERVDEGLTCALAKIKGSISSGGIA